MCCVYILVTLEEIYIVKADCDWAASIQVAPNTGADAN